MKRNKYLWGKGEGSIVPNLPHPKDQPTDPHERDVMIADLQRRLLTAVRERDEWKRSCKDVRHGFAILKQQMALVVSTIGKALEPSNTAKAVTKITKAVRPPKERQ
jgi:hypothetical protein